VIEEANNINRTISQRLNALATTNHKSPTEMARGIGVTEGRIQRIYRGTAGLTAAQLVLAARVLGVNSSVITGEIRYSAGPEGAAG